MLDWIIDHEGTIRVTITCLTLVTTIFLIKLNLSANKIAHRSVDEMRISREEENRPYVFFEMQFDDHEMYFRLKNDGKTAAFKVKLTFNQPMKIWNALVGETEYNHEDMAITDQIAMLGPGEEFLEWADHSPFFFRNNEVRLVTGALTYQDIQGKEYQLEIDINLTTYCDRRFVFAKDVSDVVDIVKRIQQHVNRP